MGKEKIHDNQIGFSPALAHTLFHFLPHNNYFSLTAALKMSQQLLCNRRTGVLMKKKKQLNNKVTPKDIFNAVWPDGFVANVLYSLVDEEYQNSGIDKKSATSICCVPKMSLGPTFLKQVKVFQPGHPHFLMHWKTPP